MLVESIRQIRKFIRLMRSLARIQHSAIFLTVVALPGGLELLDGWDATGLCLPCVEGRRLGFYLAMYIIATVLIALASRVSETKVERQVNQISSEFHEIHGELEGKVTAIRDSKDDLLEWVGNLRTSLEEQLEISLPGHIIRVRRLNPIRANSSTSEPKISIRRPQDWRLYVRSWTIDQGWRIRRWFLKWVWDLKCDQQN